MAHGDTVPMPEAQPRRAGGLATLLRTQMRNIAPFLTLIFLTAFFAIARDRKSTRLNSSHT